MNDIGLGFRLFTGRVRTGPTSYSAFTARRCRFSSATTAFAGVRWSARHHRHRSCLCIGGDAARGFMMDGDFIEGTQALRVEAGPSIRFVVGS